MGIFRKKKDPYAESFKTVTELGTLARGDIILTRAAQLLTQEELHRLQLGLPPRSRRELLLAYEKSQDYLARNQEIEMQTKQNELNAINQMLGTEFSANQAPHEYGEIGQGFALTRKILDEVVSAAQSHEAESAEISTANGSSFSVERTKDTGSLDGGSSGGTMLVNGEWIEVGAVFNTPSGTFSLGKFADIPEDNFIDMDDDDWGPQG
jgi:hypothetical protein